MLSLGSIRERISAAAKWQTQNTYSDGDGDRAASRLLDQIVSVRDPGPRTPILAQLADVVDGMAEAHRVGRGPGPEHLAVSHTWEAMLYRLIADVERAAAGHTPRRLTDTLLEPAAGPVLDRMAATVDAEERGELLDDLYEAVAGVVGGQAAEAVHCLPAPGHHRVRTLGQIATAVRARLTGRGVASDE